MMLDRPARSSSSSFIQPRLAAHLSVDTCSPCISPSRGSTWTGRPTDRPPSIHPGVIPGGPARWNTSHIHVHTISTWNSAARVGAAASATMACSVDSRLVSPPREKQDLLEDARRPTLPIRTKQPTRWGRDRRDRGRCASLPGLIESAAVALNRGKAVCLLETRLRLADCCLYATRVHGSIDAWER